MIKKITTISANGFANKIVIVFAYFALMAVLKYALDGTYPLFIYSNEFLVERAGLFDGYWLFVMLLSVVAALFLPTKFEKVSDFVLHLQYLFPIVPMLALYTKFALSDIYMAAVLVSFLVLVFFVRLANFRATTFAAVPAIHLARIFFAFSTVVVAVLYFDGGWRYLNFDFNAVYEYRQEAAENRSLFFGYVISLVSKVLLPFVVVCGVYSRSYVIAGSGILLGWILFGLTSHKAVLFYPIMALIVYSVSGKFLNALFFWGGCLSLSIASLAFYGFGGVFDWLLLLYIDRLAFVPSQINFMFYDWFSQPGNPLIYWSDSKVTLGFLNYPYDIDVPHLIGREYFGSAQVGANTSWISAGYAHLGLYGLVIYSLIIGLILSILNSYSRILGVRFVLAVSFGAVVSLVLSADLPNAILSHGILLVLVLLPFIGLECSRRKS